MDIAIVTGASSSLGMTISRRLIQLGFRVYGLGGDYSNCDLQNVNFRPVSCDLTNPEAVEAAAGQILEKEKGVYLLVNNAKYFGRNRFFEMQPAEIENILRINLLCPLILVRKLAQSLKALQGFVIQLGAPHADTSRGGAAGAAATGGLKWMGEVLFNDLRAHGVRVCHLSPEPNPVKPLASKMKRGARPEASIDPEAVAQAVEQMLQSPFGNVITEMVLRPLRVEEPEQEPVVNLPYPDPQPIPYTVPREYIEAEEQLDEEERKQAAQNKRKQRRRKAALKEKPAESKKPGTGSAQPATEAGVATQETEQQDLEQPKKRRRSRRKPKPPAVEVGFHKPSSGSDASAPASKQEAAKEKKPARKAARKSTKKTAGKSPVKKTATKKAARKAVKKVPPKKAGQKADEDTSGVEQGTAKKVARKAVKKAARKAARQSTARKATSKAGRKVANKTTKPADTGREPALG